LESDTPEDIDFVSTIQQSLILSAVPCAERSTTKAPLLVDTLQTTDLQPAAANIFPGELNSTISIQLLSLLAAIFPYAPAETVNETSLVASTLRTAGLTKGTYTPPSTIDFAAASTIITSTITADFTNPALNINSVTGNFSNINPAFCGDFHSQYTVRAYIAWFGYLMLQHSITSYPTYFANGTSTIALTSSNALLFTFPAPPPVTGFWSLTAYNLSGYLIPNTLDRFGQSSSHLRPSIAPFPFLVFYQRAEGLQAQYSLC